MADKFEIGEVAIYVRPGSPYYGQEVEILGGLTRYEPTQDHLGLEAAPYVGYQISSLIGDDWVMVSRPEWLRKKKPPRREMDQIVSWEDCAWRPATVGVG